MNGSENMENPYKLAKGILQVTKNKEWTEKTILVQFKTQIQIQQSYFKPQVLQVLIYTGLPLVARRLKMAGMYRQTIVNVFILKMKVVSGILRCIRYFRGLSLYIMTCTWHTATSIKSLQQML